MKSRRFTLQILISLTLPIAVSAQTMQVLHLDGNGAYVVLDANMFHQFDASTIEAWVKWDRIKNWSRVFDFGREGNAFVVQSEKSSRTLNFAIYDRNSRRHRIQARNAIPVGQWFHLAVSSGPKGMTLYINGEAKGHDSYTGGLNQVTGGRYFIGRSNWPDDDAFQGYISEFRIWNRQRSRTEISRTMERRLAGTEPGLVACWRFDSASSGQVPNAVANQPAARLERNGRTVSVPAIAKYLVPGAIEKDMQSFLGSAQLNLNKTKYLSAYRNYQAALDLRPDNEKARTGMLTSLDKARIRAALLPFQTSTENTDADQAYQSAWTELATRRPAYIDWTDPATLEFIFYTQGIGETQDTQAIIEAAKKWNIRLIALGRAIDTQIKRSRAKHENKKAVQIRLTPMRTSSGQDSIRETWNREQNYAIITRNVHATGIATIQIIDTKTGNALDRVEVTATASDKIEYADYRGNASELWIQKRNGYESLTKKEKRFTSRKELKSDAELISEVMQNLGKRMAQRIQSVLDKYEP